MLSAPYSRCTPPPPICMPTHMHQRTGIHMTSIYKTTCTHADYFMLDKPATEIARGLPPGMPYLAAMKPVS